MLACFLARCAKLFPDHLVNLGIPTEATFLGGLLVDGWVIVRWVVGGNIKIKAKLSPAGAGAWAELGNKKVQDSYLPNLVLRLISQNQYYIQESWFICKV